MSSEAVSIAQVHAFDLPRLCRYFSDCSPQPMIAVEGSGHVVRYLNPAFARLAGKTADELLGRPFAEAVLEGEANECLALLNRVFRTGMPENLAEQERRQAPPAYWSYAMWAILGADNKPVGVMIQVMNATEAAVFRRHATAMNEALIVSSVRQHELIDTIQRGEQERRELEAQIFQAQKLESLSVLAGGIAHDLNNMLTPVVGFAELASNTLPEGSPAAPMLEEVGKNARRAADLVQQILAFAGKGRFVLQPVDLSVLVREMGALLGSAVSINTELRYDLAPDLPPVEADITQLRQVVMNLVTNAAEAIQTRGTITVRTGWMVADPRLLFLEVADSGCGMTAEVIQKIFDPFFTTKFTGRGLGLAVVQGIARGHHGTIEVHSKPGKGSTFRLLLPCSAKRIDAPVVSPQTECWRDNGTVLVIDDEKGVREVAAHIFQQAGLTVLVAGDGEEGLRMMREHSRGIDAVVVDLTMPRMSGLETTKRLRGLRPNLPVVLMSGFSVVELTLQSAGLGITGFVQKPFKATDLLAAVRLALGQR